MRIVLVCPYAWDSPGGVQVHVRDLAERLASRGHEPLVLAPAFEESSTDRLQVVGRAVRVPYQGTVAPICFSPRSLRRTADVLLRFRPDVVHVHEPLAPSISLFATLRSRAPTVGTFHAHAERSRLLTAAAPLLRGVWRRLRVRIAVSEAASAFVGSRFGDGIRVIPNGCDVERFKTARPLAGMPSGRRLLWVGRLDRQKGFPIAIRAFGLLAREIADLWLLVVGDGRDRGAVAELPAEARRRVLLYGDVAHADLPAYHASSDVFLSAALGQESFGMVLVEAMAAGLPVVATDITGYREVLRHQMDGLLVPPNDPAALANALRDVLSEPALAERLTSGGRARAERYRWDVVAEEIEDAYRDALVPVR
jgi:phosphatidyl-myo-inositol alpha-mannosyltransferase